jgi:hypothetical protein
VRPRPEAHGATIERLLNGRSVEAIHVVEVVGGKNMADTPPPPEDSLWVALRSRVLAGELAARGASDAHHLRELDTCIASCNSAVLRAAARWWVAVPGHTAAAAAAGARRRRSVGCGSRRHSLATFSSSSGSTPSTGHLDQPLAASMSSAVVSHSHHHPNGTCSDHLRDSPLYYRPSTEAWRVAFALNAVAHAVFATPAAVQQFWTAVFVLGDAVAHAKHEATLPWCDGVGVLFQYYLAASAKCATPLGSKAVPLWRAGIAQVESTKPVTFSSFARAVHSILTAALHPQGMAEADGSQWREPSLSDVQRFVSGLVGDAEWVSNLEPVIAAGVQPSPLPGARAANGSFGPAPAASGNTSAFSNRSRNSQLNGSFSGSQLLMQQSEVIATSLTSEYSMPAATGERHASSSMGPCDLLSLRGGGKRRQSMRAARSSSSSHWPTGRVVHQRSDADFGGVHELSISVNNRTDARAAPVSDMSTSALAAQADSKDSSSAPPSTALDRRLTEHTGAVGQPLNASRSSTQSARPSATTLLASQGTPPPFIPRIVSDQVNVVSGSSVVAQPPTTRPLAEPHEAARSPTPTAAPIPVILAAIGASAVERSSVKASRTERSDRDPDATTLRYSVLEPELPVAIADVLESRGSVSAVGFDATGHSSSSDDAGITDAAQGESDVDAASSDTTVRNSILDGVEAVLTVAKVESAHPPPLSPTPSAPILTREPAHDTCALLQPADHHGDVSEFVTTPAEPHRTPPLVLIDDSVASATNMSMVEKAVEVIKRPISRASTPHVYWSRLRVPCSPYENRTIGIRTLLSAVRSRDRTETQSPQPCPAAPAVTSPSELAVLTAYRPPRLATQVPSRHGGAPSGSRRFQHEALARSKAFDDIELRATRAAVSPLPDEFRRVADRSNARVMRERQAAAAAIWSSSYR